MLLGVMQRVCHAGGDHAACVSCYACVMLLGVMLLGVMLRVCHPAKVLRCLCVCLCVFLSICLSVHVICV